MTDHGMPSRFGSEVAPPEELFLRVRSAVAATPAAKTTTRLRTIVAAAGAWAGLGIFIYCPATEYHHLLVGHVLPIAALTLLGLAAIPRALRP